MDRRDASADAERQLRLGTAAGAHSRRTGATRQRPDGRQGAGVAAYHGVMCRNIKTLFNFEPPATELEIRDASLQFVRKLSGFNAPSQANRAAFERATADVAAVARTLIESLVTTAAPRDREVEAARAKARSAARFGQS